MLNRLMKSLKNPMVLTALVIALVIIISLSTRMEGFSKLPRYMYMYSPTSKNSSYQTRGEPVFTKKDTSKTGAFYESSLDANETNQRVRPFYHGMRFDLPRIDNNMLGYIRS